MKYLFHISSLLLTLALASACTHHVDISSQAPSPCPDLSNIDTLMWHQPDSALKVMLEFAESGKADSLDEFDDHYCQLLISELLYKNDYAQSNRKDLLKAVDYFDNSDNAFLSARAHYINGVGYYEQDSVVEACTEYLKALEIMEMHFPNVETQDFPALRSKHLPRFMTLTYSRIGELFASQFMQEPAIACFKKSLVFDNIEPCSPNNRSCLLLFIGKQYYKLSQSDSAEYYFDEALRQLHDTNNAVFRDLVSYKALLDYDIHHHVEAPINDLKRMIAQATNENELLARYTTLGVIYFLEGQYDLALFYLTSVFENNNDVVRQRAVSPYLRTIYQNLGDSLKADQYAVFIADNELSEGENKAKVSQLNDLFQQHLQWEQDRAKAEEHHKKSVRLYVLLSSLLVVMLLIGLFVYSYRKRKESESIQLREAQHQLKAELEQSSQHQRNMLQQRALAIYQSGGDDRLQRILDEFESAYPSATVKLEQACPNLNKTELRIVILSFLGFRAKEVADLLGLKENTVTQYRSNLKKKADIDGLSASIW